MAYRISNSFVDVCEDDYENGCSLDIWTEEFPASLFRKTFETKDELKVLIAKEFYMEESEVEISTYTDGEDIQFLVHALVDDDRLQPSEAQLEHWKRGELKLYAMDIYFNVEKVTPVTEEDIKQLF